MEIVINQAILHVLDTTLDAPVLSGAGMELTAEKTTYLQAHIEKLFASDELRSCRFLPESAFAGELASNRDFVDFSCRVAGVMFDYMHAHPTIPSGDLAVADFDCEGRPWLAVLKLNYKNGYVHFTEQTGGVQTNTLLQQRTCLPTQTGKVEEGALIDLDTGAVRLLEKKYDIDGKKDFYLSTVVFQCSQTPPDRKKLAVIQQAAEQAVQDAYDGQEHVEAQVAMLIRNQAVDNKVSAEAVRRQLAEEFPLAAVPFDDYIEKSDAVDAAEPVTVTPARIRRMESRSIRSQSGIEVKIPAELLASIEDVEFLHDPDGSVSVLIKNVLL